MLGRSRCPSCLGLVAACACACAMPFLQLQGAGASRPSARELPESRVRAKCSARLAPPPPASRALVLARAQHALRVLLNLKPSRSYYTPVSSGGSNETSSGTPPSEVEPAGSVTGSLAPPHVAARGLLLATLEMASLASAMRAQGNGRRRGSLTRRSLPLTHDQSFLRPFSPRLCT